MSLHPGWLRLGLTIGFIGGLFTLGAFIEWSFLASAYDLQCTGASPASSCDSLASSAGFWAALLVLFVVVLAAGLALALGGYRTRRSPLRARAH